MNGRSIFVTGSIATLVSALRTIRRKSVRPGRTALSAALLIATSCAAQPPATMTTIPRNFFGLHVNNAAPSAFIGHAQTPMPDLGQHGIRLQDAQTDWRHLNPYPDVFDWRVLDARVAQDEALGLTTMLVLGNPPAWVKIPWLQSDASDRANRFLYPYWTNYITAVSQRYGNRIAFYELWNEPDVGGFNGGRLDEMLELTRLARPILARNAPHSKLISPAFSLPDKKSSPTWHERHPVTLESFLAAGGGRYVDIVSIHAYPGDGNAPETLTDRLHYARSLIDAAGLPNIPLIDSESGARGWRDETGKIHDIPPTFGELLPTSPVDLQTAYVSRTLLTIAASGVVRQSYYFTFDNGDNARGGRSVMSVLMTKSPPNGTILRPALAYRYLAGLLPGTQISALQRVGGHWEVAIHTPAGREVRVYWCDDYRTDLITLSPGADVHDAAGAALQHDKATITIDASPIFVFRKETARGKNG